jgi:outer membrane lipoprotein-sorting protein
MIKLNNLLARPLTALAVGGLVVSAPLALPLAPAAAQADGRLDQAVAALRGISTMRANFTQTDRNGQRVSGVLTLKRPGKIRFEYEKGVNLLIVSNGSSLTMVDYDVNQVERWPIKESPLGALLDPTRDVKRFGRLQPTSNPDVISIEVRDAKHPEYGVITLVFSRDGGAPGGWELSSWVSLDSQNKRTTVRLSGQQYGVSVSDSAFKYRDPRTTGRRQG